MGIKVDVTFTDGRKETFRNVTEIHYNYTDIFGIKSQRILFESDILHSGVGYPISEIKEFETMPETKSVLI